MGEVLRAVFDLNNVSRAPGQSGVLKRFAVFLLLASLALTLVSADLRYTPDPNVVTDTSTTVKLLTNGPRRWPSNIQSDHFDSAGSRFRCSPTCTVYT